jgi:hypothetical protein
MDGWFDSDERFQRLLKSYSSEIHALIDRLHSALRTHRGLGLADCERR